MPTQHNACTNRSGSKNNKDNSKKNYRLQTEDENEVVQTMAYHLKEKISSINLVSIFNVLLEAYPSYLNWERPILMVLSQNQGQKNQLH